MTSHNSKISCRVAVLLAAYNGVDYIEDQISSILNQLMVDVDIYISVDKSTDGTEALLLSWAAKDSRIKILSLGQVFGGAAPNFFRLIRDVCFDDYDYIALSDQDDLWFSDKLMRAHKVLVGSGADGYSSNVAAFWPNGFESLIKKSQAQTKWDFLFEAAGPGCTYVMRKKLACAVQVLVQTHWNEVQEVGLHDWFAYAFARANGYRWVIDDIAGMRYRQHENNQVGVNAGWRAFVYRADKVLSGWGLAQSALIARLIGLSDTPFVLQWSGGSRLGLLYLALRAGQCRRRVKDKFIFGLSCLVLSVIRRRRR